MSIVQAVAPALAADRDAIRSTQAAWADRVLSDRLAILRHARHLLSDRGLALAESTRADASRPVAEKMVAEVIPLADACRFLEREAGSILRPRRLGRRGRPAWLVGVEAEVRREPIGVVLLIGPSNYPLLIPGVQALQALAAGNAVLWKPGAGGGRVARMVLELLVEAGLDPGLVRVLDESADAAREAIERGVDKVILTGSAAAGRAVLADLAARLVPATMELSGADAAFVLDGADLDLVVRAIAFGLRFNGAETCIAPRRVFVGRGRAADLESRLIEAFAAERSRRFRPEVAERALPLVFEALDAGARLLVGRFDDGGIVGPVVLADVAPAMRIASEELFGPVLTLTAVDSDLEALRAADASPHALGASIFGEPRRAKAFAGRVRAGSVVVNDLIAPTADPRLPFGGRGRSGFGLTRGAEGLLEMTVAKAVSVRKGRARPHYDPLVEADVEVARSYLEAAHGGTIGARLAGTIRLFRSLWTKARGPEGGRQGS